MYQKRPAFITKKFDLKVYFLSLLSFTNIYSDELGKSKAEGEKIFSKQKGRAHKKRAPFRLVLVFILIVSGRFVLGRRIAGAGLRCGLRLFAGVDFGSVILYIVGVLGGQIVFKIVEIIAQDAFFLRKIGGDGYDCPRSGHEQRENGKKSSLLGHFCVSTSTRAACQKAAGLFIIMSLIRIIIIRFAVKYNRWPMKSGHFLKVFPLARQQDFSLR